MRTGDRALLERACAEAYACGALGLEEREAKGGAICWVYAPAGAAAAVADALSSVLGAGGRVSRPGPVPDEDWAESWKAGLEPIDVSPGLRIRPSFWPAEPRPGRAEVAIEPGQAFGTGGHVSTRLALALLAECAAGLPAGARILDVGTGSGVLALAALRLCDGCALGLDLDPLAPAAARDNARRNGLAPRLAVFAGGLAALRDGPFDLVLANLLSRELLPELPALAARTRPGAVAVLSGLLEREVPRVAEALARQGLRLESTRREADPDGVAWAGLVTRRAPPASGRAGR